jgi:ankyrin repeat protein
MKNSANGERTPNDDALIHAVRFGDVRAVRELLRSPIDINKTDNNGCTALMLAARNGHPEIVCLLLEQPAIDLDVFNHHGETALMLADTGNHPQIVLLLLLRGANTTIRPNQNMQRFRPLYELSALAAEESGESISPLLFTSPEDEAFSRRMQTLRASSTHTYQQLLEHILGELQRRKERLGTFLMGTLKRDNNYSAVQSLPIDVLGIIANKVIRPPEEEVQTRRMNVRR